MTKDEIIAQLKSEYPTIKIGSDELGYEILNKKDYESTISQWAENIYNQQSSDAAKEQAKADLLARLGITKEEAALLLG